MNEIKKELIEIQSHQPKNLGSWVKIEIVDNQNRKFQFGTKKKDGNETKAFTFYKEHKARWDDLIMMGQPIKVVVSYDEMPKSFIGDKGNTINYIQRTIKLFSEPKEDDFKKVPEYNNPAFTEEMEDTKDDVPVIEDDEPYGEEIPF